MEGRPIFVDLSVPVKRVVTGNVGDTPNWTDARASNIRGLIRALESHMPNRADDLS